MIFDKYLTIQEEQARAAANRVWGGSHHTAFTGPVTPEAEREHYARRRQTLADYACLPLHEAAETYGFDADTYMDAAAKGKALAFTLENGEQMIPVWGLYLDENEKFTGYNPLPVEVAKIFRVRKPTDDAANFCRFLAEKQLGMSAELLYSETNPGQPLSNEFKPRPHERLLSREQPKTLFRSMMYAVTMAYGDNQEYVTLAMHNIVPRLLDINRTGADSIELVINTMIPGRQQPSTLKYGT